MDNWRQNLDKAFGEAPAAPADEFAKILRRTQNRSQGQVWPALLCAAALVCGVLVSVFIRPQAMTIDTSTLSMLTVEMTSPYDESLEGLEDLADQIK